MLWRARHPGWWRLFAALALGPQAAPIVVMLLEPRPLEGLVSLMHYPSDGASFSGVAYVVTILFGLPVILVLARYNKAGFIPVLLAGVLGGAACAALGSYIGGGDEMFASSLAVATACWLIAFFMNPRARPEEPVGNGAKAAARRAQASPRAH